MVCIGFFGCSLIAMQENVYNYKEGMEKKATFAAL